MGREHVGSMLEEAEAFFNIIMVCGVRCLMCECVMAKLCDDCLYWLIHIHQLMNVNLLYQCLKLSCSCVCVVECHLWLEITYVQQTL